MKGVSDNVISVAMVMVLPPKLSFCTIFPILESPSDFLLSFGKKRSLKKND